MSTKTTFKRVALVAVAALGFGVLTSVAPASAAITATGISAGTSGPARVGVTSYTTITITHAAMTTPSGSNVTDTFVAAAKITSVPATSTLRTDTNTATKGVTIANGSSTSTAGTNTYAAGAVSATVTRTTLAAATSGATTSTFKVGLTPDVAGTYTVLVSVGNTSYTAGDFAVPVTITTVGAPATITVAKVAGAVVQGGSNGQLLSVTMKDANGNPTVLAADEGINVTDVDDTIINTNAALAAGEENNAGAYIVGVKPATTGTALTSGSATITFTGTGLLSSSLTTNTTVTLKAAATATTDVAVLTTDTNSDNETGTTSYTATVKGATSIDITGHALASTATAATNKLVVVTSAPLAATIATGGNSLYIYDDFYSVAIGQLATEASTYTMPAPATAATVAAVFGQTTVTLSYAAAAAKTLSIANTVSSVLSATAGTNTFTAKVVDQYGAAVANVAVSVSVSGRNTVASKVLGITDANGLISYSFTDAGTTGTRDTVTFSATVSGTGTAVAYVNYGTVTVDSVTVSGGSKAETVAGSTLTAINGADNGPETSAKAIKAVVKDASGNLLAGVPVTFTVDAGAIKKTASVDYATVYTGSDGSATTYAFNWLVGKQTITATAGGKSSTDYLTWAATDATSARVLSATSTGDIVSLKVVDRFGNAVKGVAINLSRTGTGLFGNGASTQDISTDKNGTADVRFTGSGTVVAELAATYAQAYDVAGQIAETAVTAAVAGTTKGTGASLAPAGVSKVSVAIAEGSDPVAVSSQAAADAAAEATDAANAATDAANAAAEAADAATAAAQDAADAVAALSTQVSEMVSALKKQITALTNLVIKIQKKVNA
jgi:trimeric autotransporter adhesin